MAVSTTNGTRIWQVVSAFLAAIIVLLGWLHFDAKAEIGGNSVKISEIQIANATMTTQIKNLREMLIEVRQDVKEIKKEVSP